MESYNRRLCTYKEGPAASEKNMTENGKLLKLSHFPWRTHGAVLSMSHYKPQNRVQQLKRPPKCHKGTSYTCMIATPGEKFLFPTGIKGDRKRHGAFTQNTLIHCLVCKNFRLLEIPLA